MRAVGVRIPMRGADTSWHILAAPDAASFRKNLEAAEAQAPFDAILPIATQKVGEKADGAIAFPGLLFDGFPPLSLPGPGLEFRIDALGEWSARTTPRQPSTLRLTWDRGMLPIDALNETDSDGPGAWTEGFGPRAMLRVGARPHDDARWLRIAPAPNPWPDDCGAEGWEVATREHRAAAAPRAKGELVVRMPMAAPSPPASARLRVDGLSPASPVAVAIGGAIPITAQGRPTPGLDAPPPGRADLAPCFATVGRPYTFLGFSRAANAVWIGCTDDTGARPRPPSPAELGQLLADERLETAGILALSRGAGVRWRGQWLGAQGRDPMGRVTAALCARLGPASPSANALADWRVTVQTENVSRPGLRTAPLHDARTLAGAGLDSFWWARADDASRPVAIDFDLRDEATVAGIEVRLGSAAGFAHELDLRAWRWLTRSSASSPWRQVASATPEGRAVHRTRLPRPVRARWWRMEVPPAALADTEGRPLVLRIAEICLWRAQAPQ